MARLLSRPRWTCMQKPNLLLLTGRTPGPAAPAGACGGRRAWRSGCRRTPAHPTPPNSMSGSATAPAPADSSALLRTSGRLDVKVLTTQPLAMQRPLTRMPSKRMIARRVRQHLVRNRRYTALGFKEVRDHGNIADRGRLVRPCMHPGFGLKGQGTWGAPGARRRGSARCPRSAPRPRTRAPPHAGGAAASPSRRAHCCRCALHMAPAAASARACRAP